MVYPYADFREASLRPQLIQERNLLPEESDSEEDQINWLPHFTDKERYEYVNRMKRRRKEITDGIKQVPFGFEAIIRFNQRPENLRIRRPNPLAEHPKGFDLYKQVRKDLGGR